jgi:hypothetical protein
MISSAPVRAFPGRSGGRSSLGVDHEFPGVLNEPEAAWANPAAVASHPFLGLVW